MLKSLLLIVFAATAWSSCRESSKTDQDMTSQETRDKNLAVINSFFELMHQKKIKEWTDLWDENGFIYIPYPVANFPDSIKSKKTIGEGFQHLFAGFKSFDYKIKNVYPSTDPDTIVVEYTATAVLLKSNEPYEGTNIAVFKFRNGKISGYHDYFNPEKFKIVVDAIS
jgi:uncharacterized protein